MDLKSAERSTEFAHDAVRMSSSSMPSSSAAVVAPPERRFLGQKGLFRPSAIATRAIEYSSTLTLNKRRVVRIKINPNIHGKRVSPMEF